jgi:hypothetical protein
VLIASYRAFSLAILVTGIAGASAAQAASIGYVELFDGNIGAAGSYNSAGGTNSLATSGNTMEVTLPGLGNSLHSNVQVNAVNNRGVGHYCTSDGWFSSNGVDVTADVTCFDALGNPILEDFSLFYQARTKAPAKGAIAFLWASRPTTPSYTPAPLYNFNSTGKSNTVTRSSTGLYAASLPGLTTIGGNPQVTAYGGVAARCEVAKWFQNRFGTTVSVYCVNSAGVAADERFSLSYTIGTNAAAGPVATALGGYAWANNPVAGNYVPALRFQFDSVSTGPLTAQRFGQPVQGQYSLTVPNPNNIPFVTIVGMVTANGSSGEYCNPAGENVLSGEFYLDLFCYDSAGRPLDTRYTGTFFTSH